MCPCTAGPKLSCSEASVRCASRSALTERNAMCGICGRYNFGDHRPADPVSLRTMARSIEHRGPDDEGFFIDGSLGLGFRRLSIIDLEGGHQPMSDRDEQVWVVFNGEIFNFLELRAELM